MSKNYAIYPMRVMKITQNYNGNTSHAPNTLGTPKDYPIDDAGKDSGRDYMFCPCDKMKIVRLYGVGNGGTNTIWLTSTSKVLFADGTYDYLTLMVLHPNDDDLKRLKVGQVFKRGEKMFREGTDGHSFGNHVHFSVGKGKIKGNGWVKNSKGKWVLSTTNGTVKPEKAFYVDKTHTTVKSAGGLKFLNVPTETPKTETVTFKKGDKVTIKNGATSYDGKKLSSWVYKTTFTVLSVSNDKITIGLGGKVTARMKSKDLIKAVNSK